jgi:26S proteasome regulatory subunit N6
MLLAKIMMGEVNDVYQFLSGKHSLQYRGREFDAVKAIADASKAKSIQDLKQANLNFKKGKEI